MEPSKKASLPIYLDMLEKFAVQVSKVKIKNFKLDGGLPYNSNMFCDAINDISWAVNGKIKVTEIIVTAYDQSTQLHLIGIVLADVKGLTGQLMEQIPLCVRNDMIKYRCVD